MEQLMKNINNIEKLLNFRNKTVGVQLIDNSTDYYQLYEIDTDIRFCQAVSDAAKDDKSSIINTDNINCLNAKTALGLSNEDEYRDERENVIAFNQKIYCENRDIAKKMIDDRPMHPNVTKYLIISSDLEKILPQCLLFICEPYQAYLLICGYCYAKEIPQVNFNMSINSAVCSWAFVNSYQNKKMNMVLPCMGAITFSRIERNEVIVSFPLEEIHYLAEGVIKRYEKGVC